MKAYLIQDKEGKRTFGQVEIAQPKPKENEVLIQVKATSINYRDLGIATGDIKYPGEQLPMIPLCDGAGEVVEIGAGVTKFKPGDRVAANFFPNWQDGEMTGESTFHSLGGNTNGMLAEYVALGQDSIVKIPGSLAYEEAASLPCAAVTAWQSLFHRGKVKAGQKVLVLGTGGVSVFALQFAKMVGAEVIVTSSSDEKLGRAKELGADYTINYKTHPDWDKEVKKLVKEGVDHIIEVGGSGTLQRSINAVKVGGHIHLIGILADPSEKTNMIMITMKGINIHGIYVGSCAMFDRMNEDIEKYQVKPVIDKIFSFEQVEEAYEYMRAGSHFGKVVISI